MGRGRGGKKSDHSSVLPVSVLCGCSAVDSRRIKYTETVVETNPCLCSLLGLWGFCWLQGSSGWLGGSASTPGASFGLLRSCFRCGRAGGALHGGSSPGAAPAPRGDVPGAVSSSLPCPGALARGRCPRGVPTWAPVTGALPFPRAHRAKASPSKDLMPEEDPAASKPVGPIYLPSK